MHYDIFNGDADGICALHQLRLADPKNSAVLVTGVKRDIKLLCKVTCHNCTVTVLDISLDSNRESLVSLLNADNSITYIDHHFAGELPTSARLTTHIDTSAETCTSLIVNNVLNDQFVTWAICGAFGDNLHRIAQDLCDTLGLSTEQNAQLKEIGELLNYNSYGTTIDDLHFPPEKLYLAVRKFRDPFDYFTRSPELKALRQGYAQDMEKALAVPEHYTEGKNRVYIFPDTSWAKRVSGVFSNFRAQEQQHSAHALITQNTDQTVRVSVRAPLTEMRDADTLCREFPTGGGRKAAAGINNMPDSMLDHFLSRFSEVYR